MAAHQHVRDLPQSTVAALNGMVESWECQGCQQCPQLMPRKSIYGASWGCVCDECSQSIPINDLMFRCLCPKDYCLDCSKRMQQKFTQEGVNNNYEIVLSLLNGLSKTKHFSFDCKECSMIENKSNKENDGNDGNDCGKAKNESNTMICCFVNQSYRNEKGIKYLFCNNCNKRKKSNKEIIFHCKNGFCNNHKNGFDYCFECGIKIFDIKNKLQEILDSVEPSAVAAPAIAANAAAANDVMYDGDMKENENESKQEGLTNESSLMNNNNDGDGLLVSLESLQMRMAMNDFSDLSKFHYNLDNSLKNWVEILDWLNENNLHGKNENDKAYGNEFSQFCVNLENCDLGKLIKMNENIDSIRKWTQQLLSSNKSKQTMMDSWQNTIECALDDKKHRWQQWTCNEVVDWIISLDNGYFGKYEQLLRKQLALIKFTGENLSMVNGSSVARFKMDHFADECKLVQCIEQLVKSKSHQETPNASQPGAQIDT